MGTFDEKKEFIEQLLDADEMIISNASGLEEGCPIWEAKKKIVGLERNCKITRMNPSFLYQNPYIKNIHIENWNVGNIYLGKFELYEKDKTYSNGLLKRDPKTLTLVYDHCYYQEDIYYPSIGTIYPTTQWMSVRNNEINTFNSFINEAKGKVLLMGCGLGYLAYMLSLKDEVDEITIIELNPEIKMMFERYLKPQMNNKINIFQGDALKFLATENISMYQYCNVDIWRGLPDMFSIYLKCLLLEQRSPNTKFYYWLEESLHISMETVWLILMKESLDKKISNSQPELFTDILTGQNLETVEDIRNFIMAAKRPLIKKWALEHPKEAYNNEGLAKTLSKVLK